MLTGMQHAIGAAIVSYVEELRFELQGCNDENKG